VDELRTTDIAEHALQELAESRVREIHVIGRRGPAQAKFTNKELRELGELANCDVCADPHRLELNAASLTEIESKANAVSAKNVEIYLYALGKNVQREAFLGKQVLARLEDSLPMT
jgi:hypothetical protein